MLFTLLLFISTSKSTNLVCDQDIWTSVKGSWEFTSSCNYENTAADHSSMAWIGDLRPDTIQWSNYIIKVTMTPQADTGNGGIAFHIQSVEPDKNDGGYYYAISMFAESTTARLGKWQGYFSELNYFECKQPFNMGSSYNIEIHINNDNTFDFYINGDYIGQGSDPENSYKSGSVGFRNWQYPASFTNLEVILPNGEYDPYVNISNTHAGGWIFIGIILGLLFLYCLIGYIYNGNKSKNWKDYKNNIPNYMFWKMLPKMTIEGCCVTKKFIQSKIGKKGDGNDTPLVEPVEDTPTQK